MQFRVQFVVASALALAGALAGCGDGSSTPGVRDSGAPEDTTAVDTVEVTDTEPLLDDTDDAAEDTVEVTDAAGSDGVTIPDGGDAEDDVDGAADAGLDPVLCTSDADCIGDPCVPLSDDGEQGICSSYCELASDCPEGFSCTLLRSTGNDAIRVCLPVSYCLDRDDDGYGVGPGCEGPDCDDEDETVNPGQRERCDGRDNDCSGESDDDPQFGAVQGGEVRLGEGCETGFQGVCAAGVWTCADGLTVCAGSATPAPAELCNGLDDTCDGRVDVDADGEPLLRSFYRGPEGTEGVGLCTPGEERCEGGSWVVSVEQVVPVAEQCDELDRDCSGDALDVPASELVESRDNCGVCGNACGAGLECRDGSCVCPDGELLCGETCRDPLSDGANCGACGVVCGGGQVCDAGECLCPFGGIFCDGQCRDPQTNGQHCGSCGNVCSGGEVCSAGECGCTGGGISCDGACRDPLTDESHCGGCGITCTGGQLCTAGECGCPGGGLFCGGTCRDPLTDETNCGGCGITCTGGQLCEAGVCGCPAGQTLCGGVCRDLLSDQANCGACGVTCSGGQLCESGSCECPSGGLFCDGQCRDAQTDESHCGSCGTVCGGGQLCTGGACSCPAGQTLCGGECVNLQTDSSNCGSCGTVCTGDLTCSSGSCGCPAGRFQCGNACVPQQPGTACYTNSSGEAGVGICESGTWTCSGDAIACVGQVGPRQRVCNGADDNCDGRVDSECPSSISVVTGGTTDLGDSAGTLVPTSQGNCPSGQVITGFRTVIRNCGFFTCGIYAGDRAYGWQPVCSPISLGSRVSNNLYSVTVGAGSPLPISDGDGYTTSWLSGSCPAGEVAVGVGYNFGQGDHLNGIRLDCARVRLSGSPGSFSPVLDSPGSVSIWGSSGSTFTCASNGVLTGYRTEFQNDHAHSLRMRCSDVSVSLSP